jgi:uncharacterized protein with FMN-binding domain
MRRALPLLTATGAALAALANFHTTPAAPASVSAALGPTTTMVTAPPSSGVPGSAPNTTSTTSATATRTVDGPVASNPYGDVQVRVTLRGTQIVDVLALQLPSDRSRSVQISREAGPILRREALQAQSANIDLVSGASYTSESYRESLQGALDKASR